MAEDSEKYDEKKKVDRDSSCLVSHDGSLWRQDVIAFEIML
jgi:hypothetical protein